MNNKNKSNKSNKLNKSNKSNKSNKLNKLNKLNKENENLRRALKLVYERNLIPRYDLEIRMMIKELELIPMTKKRVNDLKLQLNEIKKIYKIIPESIIDLEMRSKKYFNNFDLLKSMVEFHKY